MEVYMPIPQRKKDESKENFLSRCMSDEVMKKEYPDNKQRVAVCMSKSSAGLSAVESADFQYNVENYGFVEEVTEDNFYIPSEAEYVDFNEVEEDWELVYKGKAAKYKGRTVKLNKPFRTPDGPKKFAVYVKNKSGKVIIVRFGDPNMEIKRDNPDRRRSFRARHKCDTAKDKTTPRYWSCKMW